LSLKLILFGFENRLRRRVIEKIPKDAKKIIELACGTGTLTLLIAKRYENVYGVDFSKEMLKRAIKKAKKDGLRINFSLQDIRNLKFNDNSFDVAIISLALHEIKDDERKMVIEEARRILKEGGRFIIFDLHKPKSTILRFLQKIFFKIAEEYADSFVEMDLVKILKDLGFKNIKKETTALKLFQIISSEKQ